MNLPITVCACIGILSVSGSLSWFIIRQDGVAQAAISQQGADMRRLIRSEIEGQLMPRVDRTLSIVDNRSGQAVAQVSLARRDTSQKLASLGDIAAIELATANHSIARIADSATVLQSVERDVAPVLVQSAETLAAIDHGIKLLTPQVLGLTAATKVTMGETAQTMRVVRDQAPRAISAAVDLEGHADAIAADVERVADKIVRPKSKKERVLGFIELIAGVAVAHVL